MASSPLKDEMAIHSYSPTLLQHSYIIIELLARVASKPSVLFCCKVIIMTRE